MPRNSQPASASSPLPDLHCACATIRRVARIVTQFYGDEMGYGIEPSQFALLSTLEYSPGIRQSEVGRALALDKTSISRNLQLMKKNGWIEPSDPVGDRRERGYRLTASGKKLLAATRPGWQRAQSKLRGAMKAGEWDQMFEVLGLVANAAQAARSKSN